MGRAGLVGLLWLLGGGSAYASNGLDTGDTAFVLVSTALVLFMTLPGLFLFYAGLLQRRNVLSMMLQCMALTGTVTLVWLAFGYSMAFDTTGMVAGCSQWRLSGSRRTRWSRRLRSSS